MTTTQHGTSAGWHTGCRCTDCRRAHSDTQRAFGRARAHKRLPVELRQQLLGAIYAGQPFRTILRDLGLTPNQVSGLTKTDHDWAAALETALTTTCRDDLNMGPLRRTYVAACAAISPLVQRPADGKEPLVPSLTSGPPRSNRDFFGRLP